MDRPTGRAPKIDSPRLRAARLRRPGRNWYTIEELCEEAARRGYRVTPRLMFDWIEKGLLDRSTPVYQGRHGKKGFLPEAQLQLLLTLLQHRHRSPRAKKIWGLLNVPVWVWLWSGDEFVPLRQLKRALRSWAVVVRRGDTVRGALHAARTLAGHLGRSPSSKGGRPSLSISRLARMLHQGRLEKETLADALRSPSSKRARRSILTTHADISPDQAIALIWARYEAIAHLDEVGDDQYQLARSYYRNTYPQYLLGAYGAPNIPVQAMEESLNHACLDLVTLLGFLRQGALAPLAPAQPARGGRRAGTAKGKPRPDGGVERGRKGGSKRRHA